MRCVRGVCECASVQEWNDAGRGDGRPKKGVRTAQHTHERRVMTITIPKGRNARDHDRRTEGRVFLCLCLFLFGLGRWGLFRHACGPSRSVAARSWTRMV